MTKSQVYKGIYDTDPDMSAYKVFCAFDKKQFQAGLEEHGLTEDQVVSAGNGFYGPLDGLKDFFSEYDKLTTRVAQECDPQEIYNYEFDNYECDLIYSDREVMERIISIFGCDRAKTVKRRYADMGVEEIEQEMKK